MHMKYLWKIKTKPDNFWVRLIKAKYLKNINVLDYLKKGICSRQWSHIMELREIFKKGICWQVGNGKSINFWLDNWIYHKLMIDIGIFNHTINNIDVNAKVSNFKYNCESWKTDRLQ